MSRSLSVGSSEPENRSTAAQVLQSFLDELKDTALLFANASPAIDGLPAAADINWASIGGLERKLKRVSMLCAEKTCMEVAGTPVAQGGGESTGLSYRSVHALLRLLLASLRSTQEPAARVADLALLTLANLLESPPWRHIFFRALNEVQLEQEQSDEAACNETPISGGGSSRGSPATLQDILWKRIIAGSPPSPLTLPLPLASRAGVGESSDTDECPQLHTFSGLASPVDHSAVRLTCHMVRHCPFSFPASSYASLAPQLTDYLLRYSTRAPVASNRGRPISGRAGDGNCKTTDIRNTPAGVGAGVKDGGLQTGLSQDLVVLLDVFAACVRGSPHFRQYVKGSRSKRELLRRLLGLLNSSAPSPSDDGRGDSRGAIVVRALCALTRLLAGDGLEAKIFERSNALETGSLVMDSLLDTSSGSAEGCYSHGSALEEQRRYAEVASDLARSPAFMAVLLESGRLGTFLRKAVGVLTRAAIKRIFRNPNVVLPQNYMGGGARRTRAGGDREGTRNAAARSVCDPSPPEPLLRALSSFCLEHSPARSTFVEALLAKSLTERQPQAFRSKNERKMADDVDGALNKDVDPLTALFALCLDPHPPTAVASSALLQCLLVGGGALGAVSGPSPGAAAGVGIIPAAYPMASARGAGVAVGGGVGREDPLQAKLLERIAKISLYGAQPANEKDGRGSSSRHGSRRRRAAGVERESDSTDGGGGYAPTASPYRDNQKEREGENDDYPGGGSSGSGSEDESGANRRYGETEDSICGDLTAEFAGLDLDSGRRSSSSSKGSITGTLQSPFLPGAALALVVCRLQHLGVDLASALANERGESGPVSLRGAMGPAVDDVQRRVKFAGEGGGEGRRGGGANSGKSLLRSSVVEAEQEATSLLCLLSSLALACPSCAYALARTARPSPLEMLLAPIVMAQRSTLRGLDPAEYPRAPVEIVLVSLTLVAQLALALNRGYHDEVSSSGVKLCSAAAPVVVDEEERLRARTGPREASGSGRKTLERGGRSLKSWRRDVARAARLRVFLGEQAASAEVKLCVGHAACRAESKDLARRVASLISLLQAGGGADALLVADALYAFAQSAEAREADLKARAAAAEAMTRRERAAGERRAAELDEADGLVAQIEARNAEELARLSREESGARQRLEEAHARVVARREQSLRRAEETIADLEKVLRGKEETLRGTGLQTRAKDLEVASLRGDLAGEQRLRAAAEAKLAEALAENREVARGKADVELLLEAATSNLSAAREDCSSLNTALEEERANASRGWAAAREAEDNLERTSARAEDAYGKLILLARGYKNLEDESRAKAAQADAELAETIAEAKLAQDKGLEEERLHRQTKTALKSTNDSLRRAEERLVKVSAEAATAQAEATAARAAEREAAATIAVRTREAAASRSEATRLERELEKLRAACAQKDLELSRKAKELGQQAGIIDYINKLSSSNAEAAAAATAAAQPQEAAAAVPPRDGATSVPCVSRH